MAINIAGIGILSDTPSRVQILQKIIDEEYSLWQRHRRITPLSRSKVLNIISSITKNSGKNANLVLNELVDNGFLVPVDDNSYQSIVFAYAHKFTDLRKYTGYCTNNISSMRTLGFDLRLCKLDLPNFSAVNSSSLSKRLRKLGTIGYEASYIVETWWPSYSEEQSEIIETITKSLYRNENSVFLIDLPTGTGKTEAFMTPAIANAADKGLSIIVYPRRALASDQVRRLINLYYRLKSRYPNKSLPSIDVYDGDSCYTLGRRKPCRGVFKRAENIMVEDKRCKVEYGRDGTSIIVSCGDEARELPITDARLENLIDKGVLPGMLITNYDMLNRLLANMQKRSFDVDYLRVVKPSRVLLVFDEAHEFQGVEFLHLLFLVARFINSVKSVYKDVPIVLVFSSATLPQKFDIMISRVVSSLLGSNIRLTVLPTKKGGGITRSILVAAVMPEPETAGQWLNQLGLFALTSFSLARVKKGLRPFKTIAFVDSLRYQWEIFNRTRSTLMDEAKPVIDDHVATIIPNQQSCRRPSSTNISPLDPLDWSKLFFSDYSLASRVAAHLANKDLQRFTPASSANPCTSEGVLAIHHGGLSQEERHTLELALKRCQYPLSVVATSTLEMGVDIPSVMNILQFRKPWSEASMMQRIGRAARSEETLYTGFASIFLTSLPSDALLVLDQETFNNYLYGCVLKGYGKPSKPEVRAPANKMIALTHLLLTALYHNPSLSRQFSIASISKLDEIQEIASQAASLVRSYFKELEKKAQAVIEAYKEAKIPGMEYTPDSLVNEILEDLNLVAEKNELALLGEIDEIRNTIISVLEDLDTYTSKSYFIRFIYSLRALSGIRLSGGEIDLEIINPEIVQNIVIKQKIITSNKFRNLYNIIVNNLMPSLESILGSISTFRYINKVTLNNIEEVNKQFKDIEFNAERAKESIEELQQELDTDFMRRILRDEKIYEKIINDIDKILQLLDQLTSIARRVEDIVSAIEHGLRDMPVYEMFALFTRKPYFNPLLRGSPITVNVYYDCKISEQAGGCGSSRTDDTISALKHSIPLSEGGNEEEVSYSFLPPGGSRRYRVKAYAIAYNPSTKSYFVQEVNYSDIARALISAQLGPELGNAYRSMYRKYRDSSRVQASYGINVDEVNIYLYSSLAKIIQENLHYRSFNGKVRSLKNAIYVVFKIEPHPRMPGEPFTIVMRVGDVRNDKIVPYKPERGLSVGYCQASNILFIGVDLDNVKPSPLAYIECPLVRVYRSLFKQAAGGGKRSPIWHGVRVLNEICPFLKQGKCTSSLAKGNIAATDVYTYLVRTKPVLFSTLDAVAGGFSRELPVGSLSSVLVKEARLMHNYRSLQVSIFGDKYSYPLPVEFRAPLLRSYSAILGFDREAICNVAKKLVKWFGGVGRTSLLLRWLFTRIILAASGALQENRWESIKRKLIEGLEAKNANALVDDVARLLEIVEYGLSRALRGEPFILSMSGLRRGAEFLFDLAITNSNSVFTLYDAFAKAATKHRDLFLKVLCDMIEISIAHTMYHAIASINGYDDVVKLYRALIRMSTSSRGQYGYALVEEREGGIGFLPTLTENKLKKDISKSIRTAQKAMGDLRAGRENALQSLANGPTTREKTEMMNILEKIAEKIAYAYGVVIPSKNGRYAIVHTFIPTWLARTVLKYDKLKRYAESLGASISFDEQDWNMALPELLPAFFDADVPDAPISHIGGVDSWLGEYERRFYQSTLLATLFYSYLIATGKRPSNDERQ